MHSSLAEALETIAIMVVSWVVALVALFAVNLVQLVRRRPSRWWGGAAIAFGLGTAAVTWKLIVGRDAVVAITDLAVCVIMLLMGVANVRMALRRRA